MFNENNTLAAQSNCVDKHCIVTWSMKNTIQRFGNLLMSREYYNNAMDKLWEVDPVIFDPKKYPDKNELRRLRKNAKEDHFKKYLCDIFGIKDYKTRFYQQRNSRTGEILGEPCIILEVVKNDDYIQY